MIRSLIKHIFFIPLHNLFVVFMQNNVSCRIIVFITWIANHSTITVVPDVPSLFSLQLFQRISTRLKQHLLSQHLFI